MITKNIAEYIMKIYNIYYRYIETKCLHKWQKVTSSGSPSSKRPKISVETVYEKQNRNMDLQLALLETTMSK